MIDAQGGGTLLHRVPQWAMLVHSFRQLGAYAHAHAHAHDMDMPIHLGVTEGFRGMRPGGSA